MVDTDAVDEIDFDGAVGEFDEGAVAEAGAHVGEEEVCGTVIVEAFDEVVVGEGAGAPGVPGAVVLLSYQRKSGTRIVPKTESVMTDASGVIGFTPPPPDFVGKAKFSLRLDFQSTIDLLDKLPDANAALRDSLVDELRAKYVEVPYEISSGARGISMAVALVDLDENGTPVAGAKAQSGLLEALIREKFAVKGIAVPADALASMDETAIAAAAKAAGAFERIAFGSASIVSVRKDGTSYLATGKAGVRVLEIASGNVLYSL